MNLTLFRARSKFTNLQVQKSLPSDTLRHMGFME